MGWVHSYRDHGGVIFIDLRDRSGLVQIVADPSTSPGAHAAAERVRSEWVVAAVGRVRPRSAESINPKLATGANREKAQRHRGGAMLTKKLKTGATLKGAARRETQNPTNKRLRR